MTKQDNLTEEELQKIRIKAYEIDKARQIRGHISQDDWNKAVEEIDREKYPHTHKIKQMWNWAGLKDKKLWDFMQLLMTPILLAVLASGLQDCSKKNEQQAANTKDKQEKLTKYLDEMSGLLLEKSLLNSKFSDLKEKTTSPILAIAQAKTVVALTSLDSTRQNSVLQFLESSGLNSLDGERGVLFKSKMYGAKLIKANFTRAKMIQAFLQHSNLTDADLTGADLRSIDLEHANLTRADLSESDLRRAQLMTANLVDSNLAKADLTKLDLAGSDMKGARLDRAILLGVNLYSVKNLTKEQLGIYVESSDKRQDNTSSFPYLCHVKLPDSIKKEIKTELLTSYTDRDCPKIKKELLARYPKTYARMYENRVKLNEQDGNIILDKDKEKAKHDFNEEITQATIDHPECVILIPGNEYKSGCNEIFKFSPLGSK
jgi:uncharacterized protein YjbI with pentapeptide repeats